MPATHTKLIAYRRVSTQHQGMDGFGMEAQDGSIEAYRLAVAGKIVAEYTEVESGKRADRPELTLALAHAKRIGARLVIAKLDRLGRNVHFISGLMETGVDFVAADSPNDDKFMLHLKAAFAEEEARKISKRTKEGLAVAKSRGVKLGSSREGAPKLAGGANLEASRRAGVVAAADADAAYEEITPIVRHLRADGLSLQAIADRLNTDGHATRRGLPWNKVQVSRVLDRHAD